MKLSILAATFLGVQHAAAAVYDVGVKFDYNEKFTGTKRCALLSVVMDESGSMSGEQSFMKNTAVPEIISKTKSKGFDHVFLCAYGYGSSFYGDNGRGDARWHGCSDGFDASVMSFVASGSFEDSFEAMTWTMENFPANLDGVDPHAECSGLAKNMILVTDEDSDHSTYAGVIKHTIDTTKAVATKNDWVINIICDCDMKDTGGNELIGASAKKGNVLMFKQAGTDYTNYTESSTLKATVVSGEGASAEDYPPVTEVTGGAIWDIGKLRNTNSAKAFTKAFIDMKVEEIVTNPHVPDPPKPTPSASGDPHFETWSGEKYDFHGGCDLVLLQNNNFANGLGMNIHVRTSIRTWWSYIETAILQLGDNTLQIKGGKNSVKFAINGEEKELETGKGAMGDFAIAFRRVNDHQSQTRVDLGNHGDAISIETFKDFVKVNIKNVKNTNFDGSVGMLGSYPDGKKVGRDGKTIFEDVNAFGQEWMVKPSDKVLFTDVDVNNYPLECTMPDAASVKTGSRRLGEGSISEEDATIACSRVDLAHRDACIFDVMATMDLDMAGSY